MSQAREEHHDSECRYVFEKVMRQGARGPVLSTEVTIYHPVSLGRLAHIMRQANEFDQRWRGELGMATAPLKRIGTI